MRSGRPWTKCAALTLAACLMTGCEASSTAAPSAGPEALPALRICIDKEYAPYSFMDEDGTYTGIDVELAEEACHRMGYEPLFLPIKWEDRDKYLDSGSTDCLWSCTTMTGREDRYLWAGPYLTSREMVAVKADSPIRSLEDLAGKRVAVMSGSSPEEFLLAPEEHGMPRLGQLYCFSELELAFSALRKDYVDAAAGHAAALQWGFDDEDDIDYRFLDEPLCTVDLGVAFAKNGGDEALAQTLTDTLADLAREGVTADIAAKYGLEDQLTAGGGER